MNRGAFVLATATVVALMGVTSPSRAQSGYIGLYLDEARSSWCASGTGVYSVDMWVWAIADPDDKGILAYHFDVSLPPNVEATHWAANPHTFLELCDPHGPCPPPHRGVFTECLAGWTWLQKCTLVVNSPDPAIVSLIPYSLTGDISLYSCYNVARIPTVVSPAVYLNYDSSSPLCASPVPVRTATWGAVKTLYRE